MPGPGVKGRPQACITCRRRKKGCDLERPSCGQCRKACIPCGGYTHNPPKDNKGTAKAGSVASGSGGSAVANPVSTSAYYPSVSGDVVEPVTTASYFPHASTNVYPTSLPASSSYTVSASGYSTALPASSADTTPDPISTTWSAELPLSLALDDVGLGAIAPWEYQDPSVSTSGDQYHTFPSTSLPMTLPLNQASTDYLALNSYGGQALETYDGGIQSYGPFLDPAYDQNTNNSLSRHQAKLRNRNRIILQQNHASHPSHSAPLAHTATTDGLISNFWTAYLPNSQPFPAGVFHITFGSSLKAMSSHSQSNKGLRQGMLALGLTTVGKEHGSKHLLEQGFRMYSEALQQVADGLRSTRGYSEEQLVATRLFGLYEALFGTELQTHAESARSWMLHSCGEAAILTANPPEAYISGTAHRLFIAGRHHMTLSSLMHRKRTFLSEKAWKTVPWSEHSKSSRDYLLDIMVDVPSLMEGIDAMRSWNDRQQREAYRKALVRATEDVIARLLKWHDVHAVDIYPAVFSEPLPERLAPHMLANSHIMTLYYSISIRIHNLYAYITTNNPSQTTSGVDTRDCCHHLIRGLRIFAHPDAGLFRQHIAPFPMSTAMQYIDKAQPGTMMEERLALLEVLHSKEVFTILQFVLTMEPLQTRSLKLPVGL